MRRPSLSQEGALSRWIVRAREWWTPDRQDAASEAAMAYARALFMPFMALVLWVGGGAVYVVRVARHVAQMSRGEQWELMVLAGVVVVGVWGVRSMVRTVIKRRFARHIPMSGQSMMAGAGISRTSTVQIPATCRAVADRYGAGFAEYVALELEDDDGEVEAMRLARLRFPGWARDNGEIRTDERRARHEAAHAVVAHALGCAVEKVTVVESERAGGYTRVSFPVPRPDLAGQHFILMSVFLAGRDVDTINAFHDTGAQSDMERLVQSAAAILSTGQRPAGYDGPLTLDGLILAATERTRSILAEQDQAVEAITAALTDRRTILGSELRNLMPSHREGTKTGTLANVRNDERCEP
jgi:hypothetical protein